MPPGTQTLFLALARSETFPRFRILALLPGARSAQPCALHR
jgi:hypothetical protein